MGCNCKKDYDKMVGYSEDRQEIENTNEGIVGRIFRILIQVVFGIFCGVILIFMAVPAVLYVTGCMMVGAQPKFKIRKKYLS